eukprot:m.130109 g.130109  ORF g.130109 m.130109 type:complete len:731 (-) comp29459_c0_seq2:169-2361(-)
MAGFLSNITSIASQAEGFLNNLDSAAAETLKDGIREKGRRSNNNGDSRGGFGSSSSSSSSAPVREWSRDKPTSTRLGGGGGGGDSPKGSPRRVTKKPHAPVRKTSISQPKKKDITSDQLFDFLNETSADPPRLSDNNKGEQDAEEEDFRSSSHSSSSSLTSLNNKDRDRTNPRANNTHKTYADDDNDATSTILDSIDLETETDPKVLSDTCRQLGDHNKLLQREVTALSDEVSTFATRVRSTQDTLTDTRKALGEAERKLSKAISAKRDFIQSEQQLEAQLADKTREVEILQVDLDKAESQLTSLLETKETSQKEHADATESLAKALATTQSDLEELKSKKDSTQGTLEASRSAAEKKLQSLQAECAVLQGNLQAATTSLEQKSATISQQSKQLTTSAQQLKKSQTELDDYKTRASRVLQMKEKTIGDLRASAAGGLGSDADVGQSATELIELRREKESLVEELAELKGLVVQLQNENQDLEQQRNEDADVSESQIKELEDLIKELQRSKTSNDRENTSMVEELKLSIEELQKYKQTTSTRQMQQETEIANLHTELARLSKSTSGTATTTLEHKVRVLTDNLLGKQSQIEALSSDKTSLTLQLETERRRHNEVRIEIPPPKRNISRPDIHSSFDEGRIQTLNSIMGNDDLGPGMRNLKHAADTLDNISIRLGVFLRRFPAARLMVIFYIMLLHIWVMVVLLTYSPEMHDSAQPGFHSLPIHPEHINHSKL